jgi:hypothetical protein
MLRYKVNENLEFYVIGVRFGSKIMKKETVGNKEIRTCVFHTSNKEQLANVWENYICKNIEDIDIVPEKNFEPLLFIYNSKHYDYHFIVRDFDELDKVSMKILSKNDYCEWDIQAQPLPLEYIEFCPNEKEKIDLMKRYLNIVNSNKQIKSHNDIIKKLSLLKEKNEYIGSYEILCELEDNINLVSFDN